ncbi:MAG: diacylglycerol/lipid kinase family protein [Xanthobacteraceae bacterium]
MASYPLKKGPTCILNGASIHVEAARAHVARISGELGVQTNVIVARSGDELSALAARAVGENYQPVVAGGGDGTVNAVAGALAGTDSALGVLPMGTLNHFAKDVGIPLDLGAAVHNVFTGHVIRVDVGEVNGRLFVNNSGVGLYPHIVRQREEQQRRGHVKWVAFVLAVGSVLRRYSRLRVRLHMGEAEALAHSTPFLFVGNNRYEIAGLEIGTRTRLDSGRLWVCVAPRTGRRNLVRMALRAFLGRVTDHELNAFETEEIWVQTPTPRVNVSTDGEVSVMDAPLHYRIRPRALGVVVPARNGEHLLADHDTADRLHERLEGDHPVIVDLGHDS